MSINKKLISVAILALTTAGFASSALATRGTVTGVPVRITANSVNVAWLDGFDVSGVTSFGTCPTDGNGFVAVTIPRPGTAASNDPEGNRLWALALAAEQANKSVSLLLDDGIKDANGNCLVVWMYM